MRIAKTFVAIAVVMAFILPATLTAYTTPGTSVYWTGDDLVENSNGAVTWDEESGRYLFTEEVTIAETDTIVIEEDLQCTHTSNPAITIEGYFVMGILDSAQVDSLEFIGPDEELASGFRIEETGYLELNRVIADGGGYDGEIPGHSMVHVVDGSATVTGCRFTNWDRYVMSLSGGFTSVENCMFHDNHQWTININMSAEVEISGCTLIDNNLEASSAKNPISIGTQGYNTVSIENCYISGEEGNLHGGVSVWNYLGSGADVEISNVTVEGASFGVIAQGSGVEVLITDCQFIDNNIHPNPMQGGSGITVQQFATVTGARNIITGNHWGITVLTNATVMLGDVDAEDPDEQGYNQIYDNGNGGEVYNFYNNTSGDMLAQNNWWGSMDSTTVENGIFHDPDNGSLGLVTYMPLWDPDANLPPVITESEPWFHTFNFHPVTDQVFTITGNDPDGIDSTLFYHWLVNGELMGTTSSYTHTFTELGEFEIIGALIDAEGDSAYVTWNATGINAVPEFTQWAPEGEEYTTSQGVQTLFRVRASDEDDDSLSFSFYLDDELVSEDTTYSYVGADDIGEQSLRCIVTDPFGAADTLNWVIYIAIGVDASESGLPETFNVAAYPNPFNSSLHVQMALPNAGYVHAVVYDITGRQVATLADGVFAAGYRELSWNANGLASGVYIVRMEAQGETCMMKVMLIK